jgi:hypothetical protein
MARADRRMQIHLIPVRFGGGVRLFDDFDPRGLNSGG